MVLLQELEEPFNSYGSSELIEYAEFFSFYLDILIPAEDSIEFTLTEFKF